MLEAFRSQREFELDEFQSLSCAILEDGNNILVAAPTGAGKTVVAEFAVFLAMQTSEQRVFYTTPIKALSNQKYNELAAVYGHDQVGILTGDTSINPDARIVVMTTEVLRNMIYAQSSGLSSLGFAILDEVHYLADKFRGAVWEEVLIHLPRSVKTVALSATVSNAEEFGEWLQSVRGNTEIIVSENRPVPLDQHVLIRGQLVPLFDETGPVSKQIANPDLVAMTQTRGANAHRGGRRRFGNEGRSSHQQTKVYREDVVDLLAARNLLPAIFFVFSRVGCDQAVSQLVRAGIKLNGPDDRKLIRNIVEERCVDVPREDLDALDYENWIAALERGVAAHHAGLLPLFKEIVEELFQQRLVKVVFATETLALGVNMPARTVVLEKLEKFNGEARVQLSPGEYTQLTGRAGRRGIDVEGHSVVVWHPNLNAQLIAGLASKRTYPMYSSFKPTYNMTVNLIDRYGRETAREILQSSFAQYQADRTVVSLAQRVKQQAESLAGYEASISCHLGDFTEYARIRRELTDLERASKTRSLQAEARKSRAEHIERLRKALLRHACHQCPDREQHARWGERWWRLRKDTDRLLADINSRTGAISRAFDRLCAVLQELDYLEKTSSGELATTADGRLLGRIYGDRDLLVSECLRQDLWAELDSASLAALVCALVYEPRREEPLISERHMPRGKFVDAFAATHATWERIVALEETNGLQPSNELSVGLSIAMHKWASGARLDDVLFYADLPVGDFVRWAKQTIDLLDQISIVAPNMADTARSALDSVRRGVVAYASQL